MRILLLQNMLYVPCLGGANKANRLLLEGLAAKNHTCRAIVPALDGHGIKTECEFFDHINLRKLRITRSTSSVCVFESGGVEIHAVLDSRYLRAYAIDQIRSFDPALVIVSSQDPGQSLLTAALDIVPQQTVYVVHAAWDLPCGPLATFQSSVNTRKLAQAAMVLTVSNYLHDYLYTWSGVEARTLYFPAYGHGPFEPMGCFDRGWVAFINPSQIKGTSIFESLARHFPQTAFAAVPTWATTSADLERLRGLPNVRLLEPTEDINALFSQFRILLVPSLLPEGFGLAVVEAMLRGIPVLASNIGGLPEAKLGIDYVLPVQPIESSANRFDERRSPVAVIPQQDLGPWQAALGKLLAEAEHYKMLAELSRDAACRFVAGLGVEPFEKCFEDLRLKAPAMKIASSEPVATQSDAVPPAALTSNLSSQRRAALALLVLKRRQEQQT